MVLSTRAGWSRDQIALAVALLLVLVTAVAYIAAAFGAAQGNAQAAPAPLTISWSGSDDIVLTSTVPTSGSQGGTVGNRWTTWHGLPLPEYFTLMQEHLSGNPYVPIGAGPQNCTEAWFRHNLTDSTLAEQQVLLEWRRLGFVARRGLSTLTDWAGPDGRLVVTGWGTMGFPAYRGLHLWDCPGAVHESR